MATPEEIQAKRVGTNSSMPAMNHELLVPNTNYKDTPFREIRVDAAGTAILTDVFGVQITHNVLQGERIAFAFESFDSGSTATLIGLY